MTMRVISNEVRDPCLIPFSKENTKNAEEIDTQGHAVPLRFLVENVF